MHFSPACTKLKQRDSLSVPMPVQIGCSLGIAGLVLLHLSLQESFSLSVIQMEGEELFVGRMFDKSGSGRDMLLFILFLLFFIIHFSSSLRFICVISVAFNQFHIDFLNHHSWQLQIFTYSLYLFLNTSLIKIGLCHFLSSLSSVEQLPGTFLLTPLMTPPFKLMAIFS